MARKARRVIIAPASLAEVNKDLFRLGSVDRLIASIENTFAEEVARLRKAADAKLASLVTEREDLMTGINLFADANRASILEADKKSVELSAGVIGWRFSPTKVEFGRGGAEKALATIKGLELKKFIRVKESVDKEALLRDRPVIEGIRFTQKEEFFCEPSIDTENDPTAASTAVLVQKVA